MNPLLYFWILGAHGVTWILYFNSGFLEHITWHESCTLRLDFRSTCRDM